MGKNFTITPQHNYGKANTHSKSARQYYLKYHLLRKWYRFRRCNISAFKRSIVTRG
jgi:hypothetical protein